MILRAIKIRLYPNKTQEQTLNKVLGCYRFVYNQMLARKQEGYNVNKINLGLRELSKYFHRELLKNEDYSWLKEQNTKVMKQAIRQMLSSYDNFFKFDKGFPKFKSKHDNNSALFPCEAISKSNTFETKHISLIKSLKNLKFRCSNLYFSRLQRYKDNIKSATLSKTKSGKFFLSVLISMNEEEFKQFRHTDDRVRAFSETVNIGKVIVPNSVLKVGYDAFEKSSVSDVVFEGYPKFIYVKDETASNSIFGNSSEYAEIIVLYDERLLPTIQLDDIYQYVQIVCVMHLDGDGNIVIKK